MSKQPARSSHMKALEGIAEERLREAAETARRQVELIGRGPPAFGNCPIDFLREFQVLALRK